ncbi:MAG: hypothetical protein A2Z47_14595 [Thermodesulfovibrio sp. RBG_19FT_COMBO_42_12]|nr:MAG: hypothetical protein A2Z47_14595 [Thermodesulfovibrio sp. RBG_19FT_COMBO_42_12]
MDKWKADILKNPCNSTRFNSDTHDCILHLMCFSAKGWLAMHKTSRSLGARPPEAGKPFSACLPPKIEKIFANNVISNV